MLAFAQARRIPRFCTVKIMALLLCASAGLFHSGALWAANSCTLKSTNVKFGKYDPLDPLDTASTGTLTFKCTTAPGNVTYKITLSQGSSGTYTMRTMTNGANILDYNLYTDVGLTIVWGDGSSAGSVFVSGTITAAQAMAGVIFTVYGDIPAQQNAVAGSYTDSITATVTF